MEAGWHEKWGCPRPGAGGPKALAGVGLRAQGWAGRGAEGPASASHGAQESRAGPGGCERGAWRDFGGPLRLWAGW